MRQRQEGAVRLYTHLKGMVEARDDVTGWKTADDICHFLFGTMSVLNLMKTRRAITVARQMLKQELQKCFYHTENEGYVFLNTVDQFREVVKRHAAIADGFRISAGQIFTMGSRELPGLREILSRTQLKQLQDGTKIFTDFKIKARQKSAS